jgi:titin
LTIEEPVDSEEEDLIPPPMSLSLPELFSTKHQVVEVIREAVSSTELLHERAMERFYRAVEAEKSSVQTRTKFQALDVGWHKSAGGQSDNDSYPLFNARTRSVRRRMSNSGGTATTWMLKRDRRRSSEGQAKVPTLKVPNVFITAPLENVSSDPNLLISNEILAQTVEPWTITGGIGGSVERLRRWHEPGLDLSNEKSIAEMIDQENMQNKEKEDLQKLPETKVIIILCFI